MAAPYPLLRSPLPGYIMPSGSTWSGGTFGVTSTLAQHLASGRAAGTDIARYPRASGDPVRLMRGGVMYQSYKQPYHNPRQIGDGALIRRFRHAEGNTGYAHLSAFSIGLAIGGWYPAGTLVGWVGASGTATNSPHLHTHWQDNAGNHREVYWQMEQSRNFQFNGDVTGVNIRSVPSTSGAVWGQCTLAGIIRKSDGKAVAPRNAILVRRRTVSVISGGYEWLPFTIAGASVWVARNFIHFV